MVDSFFNNKSIARKTWSHVILSVHSSQAAGGPAFSLVSQSAKLPISGFAKLAMSRKDVMDEVEMIDVHVSSLIGESFLLRITASKAGEDLIEKVSERVPKKVGAHILLMHGTRVLSRHQSLKDQGLKGTVDVSIVYATVDLLTAWQNLRDQSESESAGVENVSLEGITEVKGMTAGALHSLDRLPSLESLTFHYLFNQTLKHVKFPKKLQRLTFTDSFNQSLEDVILPSTLQHLQFGDMFNQPLDHMAFPNLRCLVFGDAFNQSLEQVRMHLMRGDMMYPYLSVVIASIYIILVTYTLIFDSSIQMYVPVCYQ